MASHGKATSKPAGGDPAGGDPAGGEARWVAPVLVALPQFASVVVGALVMVFGLLAGLSLRGQCEWDQPCTGAAVWVRGYGLLHLATVLLPIAGLAMAGTVELVGRVVRGPALRRWHAAAPVVITALATALDVPVLLVSGFLLFQLTGWERRNDYLVPVAAGVAGLVLIVAVYPFWGRRLVRSASRIG